MKPVCRGEGRRDERWVIGRSPPCESGQKERPSSQVGYPAQVIWGQSGLGSSCSRGHLDFEVAHSVGW